MRVGILGPLEVAAADGETVEIGGARLRALLVRLALDAGRVVAVESLSAALWPTGGPTGPTHAVQSLVTRLRQVLPEPAVVRSAPGGYRLDLSAEAVDALRFERLVGEGRRALRDEDLELAAHRLREALRLWRGEPLTEVADAPFAAAAIARLSELRRSATEDRIAAELAAAPDLPRLVAELQELAAANPLRERPRTLLVRALHADGRAAEALAAYAEFRKLLADQLGADPGPELQRVHLAVLRGEGTPPAPATPRRHSNLPAARTSFVGRAEERGRLDTQLRDGRLVTLVGPGGSGKTRLATTAAADIADDFPGGIWLVELAPVTDPDDLPRAVVGVLGVREASVLHASAGPRDPVSRLAEALSAAETLVVLDNCEHLVDAVARLVDDLLGRCPQLRVLATSREPLGITGETLCPVPPLGLPEPDAPTAEAMTYPAVQLFVDRAAAVRPGFAVTDDNLPAVVEVCRRLDGLPLALELAAARLRTTPVAELAARLDDRFRLLTGARTALPRHQTLQAVVAWSWELLDEGERQLARRLAVFPATITPTAAEQVGRPAGEVEDLLAALVDKSLLQLVEGPEPRYRMLETIREYALARLAEAGEVHRTRVAHAGYSLRLAEAAAPHLRGADQVPWLARLAAERDNLLAALHFAYDAGDTGTALRLAAALGHFWTIQGAHAEAVSWLRLVLKLPGEAPAEARTAATAACLFHTVLSGGPVAETVNELRSLAAGADLTVADPGSVLVEPLLAFVIDDTAGGLAASDRALSDPDPWTRGMVRLCQCFLHGGEGDMDGMRADLTAAVDAFRESGDRWGLASSLTYRAYTQITVGEVEDAIAALSEAIPLLRQLDPAEAAVLQRVLLATAHARQDDVARARAELRELVASGRTAASVDHLVHARVSLGDLARRDGDLDGAARQYDAASEELNRLPHEAPLYRALLGGAAGRLAIARGEFAEAHRQLAAALPLAARDTVIAAEIGVAVAGLQWRSGEGAGRAAEALGAAHALRGAPDEFDPEVVRLTGELRSELGERAFRAAYDRGRHQDRTGALALLADQVRRR